MLLKHPHPDNYAGFPAANTIPSVRNRTDENQKRTYAQGVTEMPRRNGVLCIGSDDALLRTRVSLLAGRYDVSSFLHPDRLVSATGLTCPDLIVLCHSLSQEDCGHYLAFVRNRWPTAKVLAMVTNTRGCRLGDATFVAYDGPGRFLLKVASLLAGTSDLT